MKYVLIASLCFLFIIYCKKDDANLQESPFFDFLRLSGSTIDTITNAPKVWEYGFRFKPLVNGRISQLGISVPIVGDFIVRLYNVSNNHIITEHIIHSSVEGKEAFTGIPEIQVNAGDDLGLTIRADVFFKVQNLNGKHFVFPITKKNINIISFNEEACGNLGCAAFPINENTAIIAPCVNLVFLPR